jgi:hypothetical protein
MKFIVTDVVNLPKGKENKRKIQLVLTEYLGDKADILVGINSLKGKIFDTLNFKDNNKEIVIDFEEKHIIDFILLRPDLLKGNTLNWDFKIKMYRIGDYLFPNLIAEGNTANRIKAMIKDVNK